MECGQYYEHYHIIILVNSGHADGCYVIWLCTLSLHILSS